MKTIGFLVTFSLAIVLVNAFSTEEHVKRFFRPEHRALLPEATSLLEDDSANIAPVPENDESTKCLSVCEPQCKKLEVPYYLTVSITQVFVFLTALKLRKRKPNNCSNIVSTSS